MGTANSTRKLSWKQVLGWGLVALGIIERVLSWVGNIDLIVSRSADPGWVGKVFFWLSEYSPVWGSTAILVGFLLVIRTERRIADERYVGRDELDSYVTRQVQDSLNSGELVLDGGTFDDPVPPRSALYCYAPSISLASLHDTLRFEIAIIAFNGYHFGGRLRRVHGQITVRGQSAQQERVELALQTPSVIRDRSPETYEPQSEFMVVLFQALTPAELSSLDGMLDHGTVTFDMRELCVDIDLESDPPRTEQLAISRSPNTRRTASGDYMYNHTIFMSVGAAVG